MTTSHSTGGRFQSVVELVGLRQTTINIMLLPLKFCLTIQSLLANPLIYCSYKVEKKCLEIVVAFKSFCDFTAGIRKS